MKKMKEITFEYDRIRSWKDGNPFTIAFVYPQKSKPFVLKGGCNDVEFFLRNELKEPAIVNKTYWYRGSHRGSTIIYNNSNKDIYFCKDEDGKFTLKMFIRENNNVFMQIIKTVKRIPRKWMKELNEFV